MCHLLTNRGIWMPPTGHELPLLIENKQSHSTPGSDTVLGLTVCDSWQRIWSTPKDIMCHNSFSHSQQIRISQLVWGCSCPVHFRMFLGIPLASTHIKWQYLLLPSHQKHLQVLPNVPRGAQSCLVENHCVSITPPKICRKGTFQSKRKEFLSP